MKILDDDVRELIQAAFDRRASTWDPDKWDYTEWEEFYDEARSLLDARYFDNMPDLGFVFEDKYGS